MTAGKTWLVLLFPLPPSGFQAVFMPARRLQVNDPLDGNKDETEETAIKMKPKEAWKGERALSSANLLTLLVIEFPAG